MRKFIGKTEVELLIGRILQIAQNSGFEALKYNIFAYIKSLVGFLASRLQNESTDLKKFCAKIDLNWP